MIPTARMSVTARPTACRRFVPSAGFVGPVLMLAFAFATAPALAVSPVGCGSTQAHIARTQIDPAVCLRRAGIAEGAVAKTMQALFDHAGAQDAAGHFDEAERSLDCAEAVLGASADANLHYELIRQRGVLDFHRERIPQALARFECALSLARTSEDRVAIARDLKNIGAVLRRLGDFRGALQALIASLEMQRASGEASGAVLNNIGDIYRKLDEPDEAMRYYRDAIKAFHARGDSSEVPHVLEAMAVLSLDRGDAVQATRLLQEALDTSHESGKRTYELRVYAGLIRAALASGDVEKARRWGASGLAVASELHLPLPAPFQLQVARAERLSGHPDAAASRVRTALAKLAENDVERAPLLQELAAIQESMGDRATAIETLRRAHAEELALASAQKDQQLGWLSLRFKTAERDRKIAALEIENQLRRAELQQRTLMLWLIVSIAAAGALGVWLLLQRRRQRERLQEEAGRVRQEAELARYRREASALAEDLGLLQALLDSREDAVCLLDTEGQILAANRAACDLLAASDTSPVGHAIAEFVADVDRDALASVLERMEDTAMQEFECATPSGGQLRAKFSQWAQGDGLIVLALSAGPDTEVAASLQAAPVTGEAEMRDEFRRSLVELMLAVIDVWERGTGTSRLELAEKSRIWRITVDDGRLRARAMERYLVVAKLPQNPRWRDVLRSAYFVLGQCEMAPQAREDLQHRVDALLAYTRRSALV